MNKNISFIEKLARNKISKVENFTVVPDRYYGKKGAAHKQSEPSLRKETL